MNVTMNVKEKAGGLMPASSCFIYGFTCVKGTYD